MPDRLTIEPAGGRGKTPYFKLARVNHAGELVSRSVGPLSSDRRLKEAARILDVAPTDLIRFFAAYEETGESTMDLPEEEQAPAEIVVAPIFRVRGIRQTASEAATFPDVWAALAAPCDADDPVIEWDSIEEWCVLDLDFHGGSVPDADAIRSAADTLRPSPAAWWYSRSGSMHALYTRCDGFDAATLAALAGVSLSARFPLGVCEFKRVTRRPARALVRCRPTSDSGILTRLLGSISVEDEVSQAWMETRGFAAGERYTHDRCPVSPDGRRAANNTPPVCVYPDHVYCFLCAADGIRRGSRTPGYFPLAKLCGGDQQATDFKRCVENFTHWQHAKYVVAPLLPSEVIAGKVYVAALRSVHGDDPRVPLVFTGPKAGLLRVWGAWADANGDVTKLDKGSATLAKLPCCMYSAKDKKGGDVLKSDPAKVEQLAVVLDLSPYGYPAITRIWGFHLTQLQEQPAGRVCMVLRRNGAPEYLPRSRRAEEAAAWGQLDSLFPGLSRDAVELLIVAKGCSELSTGLPPMVFFHGPTGSGKSQTVELAAAICGDRVGTVQFDRERSRIFMAVREAKSTGSFAFFDEYIKSAAEARVSPEKAMEIVLSIKPETMAHVLYRGPVALGDLPVIVFADTSLPASVWNHSQIARRVHAVHLPEGREWHYRARDLRVMGPEVVYAADSILSHVMDRWFPPGPATDFAAAAKAMGCSLLQDSEIVLRKREKIQTLFRLVCEAAKPNPCRYSGEGWKCIDLNADGSPLTDAWKDLADESHRESRAVAEMDLKRILKLSCCCKLEIEPARNKIYVRFKAIEGSRVNEQLRESGVDGHRDPECGGPSESRIASVPPRSDDTDSLGGFPVFQSPDSLGSGEPITSGM